MTLRRPIAFALLLLALAALLVYVFVDWRFWYRWNTLPEDAGEWPDSYYQPVAEVPGNPGPWFSVAGEGERTIDAAALEAAADYAEAHNSAALLVLHRGVVQLERYWQGIGPNSLFTGRAMTRSLIPPLLAIAMEQGHIESLDDPVGRYLPQWRDDPRGEITLRNLLHNLSGLENPQLAGDPDPDNKNSRLSLGGDFRRAALNFDLVNEAGAFYAFSNANPQLLGAVLESATGQSYERYLNEHLWAPLGSGAAYLYMDRSGGMPATYCCFRATPRDWLRYGDALLNDGQVAGKQLWPRGWVDEMTTGSAVYEGYGYQIWVGNPAPGKKRLYSQAMEMSAPHGEGFKTGGVFFLEGGGFRTMYVMPEQEMVVLRLGYFDENWRTSAIPNLLLEGLERGTPDADGAGGLETTTSSNSEPVTGI